MTVSLCMFTPGIKITVLVITNPRHASPFCCAQCRIYLDRGTRTEFMRTFPTPCMDLPKGFRDVLVAQSHSSPDQKTDFALSFAASRLAVLIPLLSRALSGLVQIWLPLAHYLVSALGRSRYPSTAIQAWEVTFQACHTFWNIAVISVRPRALWTSMSIGVGSHLHMDTRQYSSEEASNKI